MMQHARIESGFRPCVVAGSLRYTYQWSGERLRRLAAFSGSEGHCPALDKQLSFADHELRTEPNFSCFWQATTGSDALAALRRGFGRGSC
jgi:hypothetical protein